MTSASKNCTMLQNSSVILVFFFDFSSYDRATLQSAIKRVAYQDGGATQTASALSDTLQKFKQQQRKDVSRVRSGLSELGALA